MIRLSKTNVAFAICNSLVCFSLLTCPVIHANEAPQIEIISATSHSSDHSLESADDSAKQTVSVDIIDTLSNQTLSGRITVKFTDTITNESYYAVRPEGTKDIAKIHLPFGTYTYKIVEIPKAFELYDWERVSETLVINDEHTDCTIQIGLAPRARTNVSANQTTGPNSTTTGQTTPPHLTDGPMAIDELERLSQPDNPPVGNSIQVTRVSTSQQVPSQKDKLPPTGECVTYSFAGLTLSVMGLTMILYNTYKKTKHRHD